MSSVLHAFAAPHETWLKILQHFFARDYNAESKKKIIQRAKLFLSDFSRSETPINMQN